MSETKEFQVVFEQLKNILKPYEKDLVLKADGPEGYSLDTHQVRKDGYVLWFGGVQIKKNYVSFHLMPVYGNPELLEDISPELRKRMQGKACFNFKKVDAALFAELSELTRKGFEGVNRNWSEPLKLDHLSKTASVGSA